MSQPRARDRFDSARSCEAPPSSMYLPEDSRAAYELSTTGQCRGVSMLAGE